MFFYFSRVLVNSEFVVAVRNLRQKDDNVFIQGFIEITLSKKLDGNILLAEAFEKEDENNFDCRRQELEKLLCE